MSTRQRRIILAVVAGLSLIGGSALATPGVVILAGPVHARGSIPDGQIVNSKSGIHLKTKGSVDVVTQQIRMAGGGSTGWHSHPGPVLVTVKAGALRLIYANDESCVGTLYRAGSSFIDRGDAVVHIARNESLVDEVELWATYLVPGDPVTTPFRIDATPAPSDC
jgi:hypothetical protein